VDYYVGDLGIPRAVRFLYGGRVVEVEMSKGVTLRFAKRGLTQFLHAIGYTRRDLKRLREQDILNAWGRMDASTVMSAYKWDGISVVYRVTSDLYTPIPHRILFQYISSILEEMGFNPEPEVRRHNVRMSARWHLWSVPLDYARPGDAVGIYLVVSNANTGNDSIKVYGYAEILKCRNGFVLADAMARVRVFHTHGLQGVLERVKEAVLEVVKKLIETREELRDRIERLQELRLTPEKREEWLRRLYETLPRKYHPYLIEQWARNKREFGETAEAVFQTITALVPRIRNEHAREKLNKYAQEVLAVARAYP
jgi:hypothetical protein